MLRKLGFQSCNNWVLEQWSAYFFLRLKLHVICWYQSILLWPLSVEERNQAGIAEIHIFLSCAGLCSSGWLTAPYISSWQKSIPWHLAMCWLQFSSVKLFCNHSYTPLVPLLIPFSSLHGRIHSIFEFYLFHMGTNMIREKSLVWSYDQTWDDTEVFMQRHDVIGFFLCCTHSIKVLNLRLKTQLCYEKRLSIVE